MADVDINDDYLVSLVDNPSERQEVEYKSWMDLNSNEERAKLAKHLCALTNYGGGWLIFGIDDEGKYCDPHCSDLYNYSHDVINSIVSKYLTPSFECTVEHVCSRKNRLCYPVVRVPAHGAAPVCGKTNGPNAGGGTVGVRKGVHYTRVPGPASVPVDNPAHWREIIHRCVINERESLLASISRLFDRPVEVSAAQDIDQLLDDVIHLWNTSQASHGWTVDPTHNRCAFAFRLLTGDNQLPKPIDLEALKRAFFDITRKLWMDFHYGWPVFRQPTRDQSLLVDVFKTDVDGLRCTDIHEEGEYGKLPTVWRISCDGQATAAVGLIEDSPRIKNRSDREQWIAGKFFSPRFQIWQLFHSVSFAKHYGKSFRDVEKIEMGVDIIGLMQRILNDPGPAPGVPGYHHNPASVSGRRTKVTVSPEALAADGVAEATATLIAPIARLFDGFAVNADSVQNILLELRR